MKKTIPTTTEQNSLGSFCLLLLFMTMRNMFLDTAQVFVGWWRVVVYKVP